MFNRIYQGDCIEQMKLFPDESIDCCVTSPPYWGLRDYGHDDQIGLEKTPEQYVAKMVDVFREVKRVVKPGGTLWLNLGDSYAGSGGAGYQFGAPKKPRISHFENPNLKVNGCKSKDLVGIPWLVAFALRADGWYLRQDIIWHKPNPMPESVTDRCTKSHEYIFLLSKSAKYYYDAEAIAEKATSTDNSKRNRDVTKLNNTPGRTRMGGLTTNGYELRNKRSVWTVTTKPFSEAHFATYPEELIMPCILAGCPVGGVVLDPFFGSGTTGVVAIKNNRQWVGCELNRDYIDIAKKRIEVVQHNKELSDRQISVFELQPSCNTSVT
jgi:DNA modification methylase